MQDPKLVLVVDDHADERAITRIVLEHFGYRVSTASTADEALRYARDRRPDLIVMDIMMPDMDGVEAIEHLAADPRTAQIPVIAYTAYRDVYRDRLDRSRFVETLEKPAGPARLLAVVADQIGSPGQERRARGDADATAHGEERAE
ncbi:MAG TPA: response regulator [Longimicrobiales bacterium]